MIMAKVELFLDTRREKGNGKYPLKLRVTHNSRFYISTGIDAASDEWDKNEFVSSVQSYKTKNVIVRGIINKAEMAIFDLEREGRLKSTSDSSLKKIISESISNKEGNSEKNFLYYMDEFISTKKNKNTKDLYLLTRSKIVEYDSKCNFSTIDKKWLERFEEWMASTMKVNAYAIHFRNIRSVFNYCIDEEYTTLYPFRKFKIKKEETRKRSLTVEQLRVLRDYPCEAYQERYRDLFMLMFYLIGINASDLFLAKKTDVVNGRLEYKRNKTGRLYSIKIEPEAQDIIDRYAGNEENGYLLNVMDDYSNYKDFLHRMGTGLKKIGELERVGRGGKKIIQSLFPDLSSYWSRHTWATIAALLDISKEVIAHALGHLWANNTTTDIYIKFDEIKVDKANRKVIDHLFSK